MQEAIVSRRTIISGATALAVPSITRLVDVLAKLLSQTAVQQRFGRWGMRARTHSVAHLPATSVIATAVLTAAWWLTMIGLTEPAAPHAGAVVMSVALGVAVVSVAAHPHVRAALAQWVHDRLAPARQGLGSDVAQRWRVVARAVSGPRTYDVAVLQMSLPRAPGGDPTTA